MPKSYSLSWWRHRWRRRVPQSRPSISLMNTCHNSWKLTKIPPLNSLYISIVGLRRELYKSLFMTPLITYNVLHGGITNLSKYFLTPLMPRFDSVDLAASHRCMIFLRLTFPHWDSPLKKPRCPEIPAPPGLAWLKRVKLISFNTLQPQFMRPTPMAITGYAMNK